MNEAFKKQYLSSHEYFQAKRWEGKPWRFRFKYLIANYPELALGAVVFTVIGPLLLYYKASTFPESRRDAIKKYRSSYIVVRDDHPNIEEIKEEKELVSKIQLKGVLEGMGWGNHLPINGRRKLE